ncbi:MAG TPA: hypothetical protein VGN11_08690 [Candidatus Baltobacteraceae bacterium]|nr:hypothetical protein [Candidatus Baltobacteraceae bacterium]
MDKDLPKGSQEGTRPDDGLDEKEQAVRRNEAVYGDTDLNPNADDQRDEHEATPDDIV